MPKRGDIEGHGIWNKVAEELDKHKPRGRPAH
jgi:hypothetical protein